MSSQQQQAVGHDLVRRYETFQRRRLRSFEGGWDSMAPGLAASAAARVGDQQRPRLSADYVSYDERGEISRVIEVKTKRGVNSSSFGLKERQLAAARLIGRDYWLYLTMDCASDEPFLVVLRDPARLPLRLLKDEPEIPWAKQGSVGAERTFQVMPSDVIALGEGVLMPPAAPA